MAMLQNNASLLNFRIIMDGLEALFCLSCGDLLRGRIRVVRSSHARLSQFPYMQEPVNIHMYKPAAWILFSEKE